MRASTVTRRALAIALCAFTIYTLMDTFVIRRSYSSQSEAVTELFPQSGEKSEDTAEPAYVLELSSSTGDPGDTAAVSGAREMFMNEGFDGFISKPIDTTDFERVMKKLLYGERPSEDGGVFV